MFANLSFNRLDLSTKDKVTCLHVWLSSPITLTCVVNGSNLLQSFRVEIIIATLVESSKFRLHGSESRKVRIKYSNLALHTLPASIPHAHQITIERYGFISVIIHTFSAVYPIYFLPDHTAERHKVGCLSVRV